MRRTLAMSAVSMGLAMAVGLAMSVRAEMPQAEAKPDQTSRKETGRGTGADPNVKSDTGVNTKDKPSAIPGPEAKTGEKSRGGQGICEVTFDNYTRLWVKTYVDGEYTGMMRPWGRLTAYAISGRTVLYARADYEGGTYDYWGPTTVQCGRSYLWRLTP